MERVDWGEDAEGAEGVGRIRQGRSGKLSIGTLQINVNYVNS